MIMRIWQDNAPDGIICLNIRDLYAKPERIKYMTVEQIELRKILARCWLIMVLIVIPY